jgi:uncharacterized protein YceK
VKHLALIICLGVALSGCSSLKKVTGQTNDTVLQGQREEILPDDQKTARDPVVAGQGQVQSQAPADVPAPAPIVPRGCNPKKQLCPDVPKSLR